MKFRAFFLILIVLLLAVPVMAFERENRDEKERLELQKYSHPERQRYTFEKYMDDLQASTRADRIQPGNPVSQLASKQPPEYKPLNPIVLFRW
jgi:hypothetical protein